MNKHTELPSSKNPVAKVSFMCNAQHPYDVFGNYDVLAEADCELNRLAREVEVTLVATPPQRRTQTVNSALEQLQQRNLQKPDSWTSIEGAINADQGFLDFINRIKKMKFDDIAVEIEGNILHKLFVKTLCNARKWFRKWEEHPEKYYSWRGSLVCHIENVSRREYSRVRIDQNRQNPLPNDGVDCSQEDADRMRRGPIPRSADEILIDKERKLIVREAKEALPKEQQQILTMIYEEGLSLAAIGERLNTTPYHVRRIRDQAHSAIERTLTEQGMQDE